MRSEREERDTAEALVTLPVPGVIVEVVVVPEYFSCCVDTHCRSFDDQTSPRQLCINCNCIAQLACSKNPLAEELSTTKKRKKSKINRIEIWIYFHAENKSIGEDLFLDTKSKIDFSSLNIKNITD